MSRGQFTGGRPETVYILEGLVKELNGIKTSKGYFTNIRTAEVPNRFFSSPDEYASVQAPALLVYPRGVSKTRSGDTIGVRYRTFRIGIFGIVKQATSVYEGILALYQDLEILMTSNLLRDRPDLREVASNCYGVFTEGQGTVFDLFAAGQSTGAYFSSSWGIDFKMWI